MFIEVKGAKKQYGTGEAAVCVMKKEKYERIELQIIIFQTKDIITNRNGEED